MSEFNFKSAICTSREQSERLLALGLKKETADMHYAYSNEKWKAGLGCDETSCKYIYPKYYIPAWSLDRLLSLLPIEIPCEVENGLGMFLGNEKAVSYFGVLGYYTHANLYDAVILCIEDVIKEGCFNKEYLV